MTSAWWDASSHMTGWRKRFAAVCARLVVSAGPRRNRAGVGSRVEAETALRHSKRGCGATPLKLAACVHSHPHRAGRPCTGADGVAQRLVPAGSRSGAARRAELASPSSEPKTKPHADLYPRPILTRLDYLFTASASHQKTKMAFALKQNVSCVSRCCSSVLWILAIVGACPGQQRHWDASHKKKEIHVEVSRR